MPGEDGPEKHYNDADWAGENTGSYRVMPDPRYLAGGIGALKLIVFTVIGMARFDDPAFGAVVGLVLGTAAYCYVTYALRIEEAVPGPAGERTEPTGAAASARRGASGLALLPVGIVPFVWRLFTESATDGILPGLLLALLTFLVAVNLLPDHGA